MRVLHILSERGFSGGEDQLLHVVRALQAVGHENRFVLQPEAAFRPHAEAHGRVIAEVRMRGSLDLRAVGRLRPLLHESGVDLIHLADSRAHKLAWLALGRSGATPPVVVTRRMDYPIKRPWLTRRLYTQRVDGIVAISQAVVEELTHAGVPRTAIHRIHDGVPADFADGLAEGRAAARAARGYADEHVVVLSAASLRPRKGQAVLLEAFASVAREHPRARLLLAGEGSDRDTLAARIRALGLEDTVALPGRVDIREALAAADVACVPSLREGLSVFSLEAQLAERPVVASRVGGLIESVGDGVSGTLVPPGDARALAVALAAMVSDPGMRARLGAAGRTRVLDGFTAEHMAARTLALYERLARGA